MIDLSTLPDHARFSPSSMSRIINCPMSVTLSEKAPQRKKESVYAAEGTKAHAYCEQALIDGPEVLDTIDDPEMKEACRAYFNYCDPLIDKSIQYGIEDKLVIGPDLFGTIDCWVLHDDGTLELIDFKYGTGVAVSPERNKQLLTYAMLILNDENVDVWDEDVYGLRLTIAQPRTPGDPIASWDCTLDEVREHTEAVYAAMRDADQINPPGAQGDHCRWCDGKVICPILRGLEQGIKDWKQGDMNPAELGQRLRDAQVLEEMIKDLFAYGHAMLESGTNIPGWKLVPKRAMARWSDPEKVHAWARREGKLSTIYEKKLITPAQAIKLLGGDSVNHLIERTSSGTNLKPSDDPAPEAASLGDALSAIGSL